VDLTALTGEFLKLGLPGAIIVVLLVALAYVYKKLAESMEARLHERDDNFTKYMAVMDKFTALANDTNQILAVVKDRMNRS
jgi:hypothetical protein